MTLLLLNTTIKISLIVLAAMAATVLLRRQSAAVRHFVLAAALACAAATPALRLVAPAWQASAGAWLSASRVQLIDRPLAVLDDSTSTTPSTGPRAPDGGRWNTAAVARALGIIWIAGLGTSAVRPARRTGPSDLDRVARRAASPMDHGWTPPPTSRARTGCAVRRSFCRATTRRCSARGASCRRRCCCPPMRRDWPADRIRIVLGHELAHVRRARLDGAARRPNSCGRSTGSTRCCGWPAGGCVSRANTRVTTRC